MKVVSLLTILLFCDTVSSDIVDGKSLSDRLKKIKDEMGVTHMQEFYNNLTFIAKTDDGNTFLQKIIRQISSSINNRKDVLTIIQNTVLNNEKKFNSQAILSMCCNKNDTYVYDLKFRHWVDFSKACVTRSPYSQPNVILPPEEIGNKMKENYKNYNILWQHYDTKDGTAVIYPSTYWTGCTEYDPRLRSQFAGTVSPRYKDLVIVLDSSKSMADNPSGIKDNSKFVIAKEAAYHVLDTLTPNDRVAAFSFDTDVHQLEGCYRNTMSFASKENINHLQNKIKLIQSFNILGKDTGKALATAFSYLSLDTYNKSRDLVILLVTDGNNTKGENATNVIRLENMKLQNRVIIFTYLLGADVSSDDKKLLQEMATQTQSDNKYGEIKPGQYHYLDTTDHNTLAIKMATYYLHKPLRTTDRSTSAFTVPYVDLFSKTGLMISMCLPTYVTNGFDGVSCTDIKLSELLKDTEYFSDDNASYAFMIDKTGRALIHPLLPDPTNATITDLVLVDIAALERSPHSDEVISLMKSGVPGQKQLEAVYFTVPRGKLINYGISVRVVNATYFWGSIPSTNLTVCVVLGDDSHLEISENEFPTTENDISNSFMYHNRSLIADKYQDCRFHSRLVTLDKSSVKFSPSAFENPLNYIEQVETSLNATKYMDYFTKRSVINPGFKASVRADVWATYELEKIWKLKNATDLTWRYIGTKSGVHRTYPGAVLQKSFDHMKRPWFLQSVSHSGVMYITPPYQDAGGSGISITLGHSIFKPKSTQVTAVVATDFSLQHFNWLIDQIYPPCSNSIYWCIIIDDSGFIVMHPWFKESTNKESFLEPIHITFKERAIAQILSNKGILKHDDCKDFSVNMELRSYRISMTEGYSNGLNFSETNNQFELKPIPETNIFIIITKGSVSISSSVDCSIVNENLKPDFRKCDSCDCSCLCYNRINYDECQNIYPKNGSLPCTARVTDTSGVIDNENLTGLKECYNPQCHTKQNETDCFSQAECGWCEFTDRESELKPKCCRLLDECYFKMTKSTNPDTCNVPTTTTASVKTLASDVTTTTPASMKTHELEETTILTSVGKNEGRSTLTDFSQPNIIAIVVSAVGGVVITLVFIGVFKLIKGRLVIKKNNTTYLDAVHYVHDKDKSEDLNTIASAAAGAYSNDHLSDYATPTEVHVNQNSYTHSTINYI